MMMMVHIHGSKILTTVCFNSSTKFTIGWVKQRECPEGQQEGTTNQVKVDHLTAQKNSSSS